MLLREPLTETLARPEPQFRHPDATDGESLWRLVRASKDLDTNSPYAYVMFCEYFRDTCLVAEEDDRIVGFIVGYRPPRAQETIFVWQIFVDASQRGRGLARQMIQALLAQHTDDGARYVEATVTPSNEASLRMFRGVSRELEAECTERTIFPESLFPGDEHEAEVLIRIGPAALQTLDDAPQVAAEIAAPIQTPSQIEEMAR